MEAKYDSSDEFCIVDTQCKEPIKPLPVGITPLPKPLTPPIIKVQPQPKEVRTAVITPKMVRSPLITESKVKTPEVKELPKTILQSMKSSIPRPPARPYALKKAKGFTSVLPNTSVQSIANSFGEDPILPVKVSAPIFRGEVFQDLAGEQKIFFPPGEQTIDIFGQDVLGIEYLDAVRLNTSEVSVHDDTQLLYVLPKTLPPNGSFGLSNNGSYNLDWVPSSLPPIRVVAQQDINGSNILGWTGITNSYVYLPPGRYFVTGYYGYRILSQSSPITMDLRFGVLPDIAYNSVNVCFDLNTGNSTPSDSFAISDLGDAGKTSFINPINGSLPYNVKISGYINIAVGGNIRPEFVVTTLSGSGSSVITVLASSYVEFQQV